MRGPSSPSTTWFSVRRRMPGNAKRSAWSRRRRAWLLRAGGGDPWTGAPTPSQGSHDSWTRRRPASNDGDLCSPVRRGEPRRPRRARAARSAALDRRCGDRPGIPGPRRAPALGAIRTIARRVQRGPVHDGWTGHCGGRAHRIQARGLLADAVRRSRRVRPPSASHLPRERLGVHAAGTGRGTGAAAGRRVGARGVILHRDPAPPQWTGAGCGAGDSDRVSILQAARQQLRYLRDLFPVGSWLVVAVAGLGLLDRRTRPLVAVSLGTVLGYAVVFKNGAYDHSYWLYCLLLPLPLGAAVAADAVSRWLARHRLPRLAPAAFAAPLVVALALTVWRPSNDQGQNRIGAALGAQARAIDWPGGQRYAYHTFGGDGYTDLLPWLRFYARREPFGIDGPASVPQGQVVLRLVDGRLRADPGERQP